MARAALCVVLRPVYWPVSSSGYLPRSFPPSLLPCSSPSSARFLPPFFPSLRACPSSILTRSLPQPFLHSRSDPPSHHRFFTPSLPHPPLAPSLPHPPLAPSLPACLAPSNSMYTVCVFGKLCTLYCVVPGHVWHWDNGVFPPEEGVVSMARCYIQRTCSHHESVFDEE